MSTSSNSNGSNVKGNPQQELTLQTPRTFMGPEEVFKTLENIGSPSRMACGNTSSESQPTQ